jgi:hypothetical protein
MTNIWMVSQIALMLALMLLPAQATVDTSMLTSVTVAQEASAKIETTYDPEKDKTTVRLAPVKIAGEVGKYHSLHMSPYFSFPGHSIVTPSIVDFELQTVVKGRLRTDLYVLFFIDGEKVFLSSNHWAVKRPIPGRVWVGERLVFRMPYETFETITRAKTFAIKFDGVEFSVRERERQALRELLTYMKPASTPH